MAPTVLVKDLLWRCSVELGDTAPQFQRFAERDMVLALSDGQSALAMFNPMAGARVDALKLATGPRQSIESVPQANLIPGDGVALNAPVRGINLLSLTCNLGADGATRGRVITIVDKDLLDAANSNWQAETGTEILQEDPVTRARALRFVNRIGSRVMCGARVFQLALRAAQLGHMRFERVGPGGDVARDLVLLERPLDAHAVFVFGDARPSLRDAVDVLMLHQPLQHLGHHIFR